MAKATRQIAHDSDRAPQTFVSRQRAQSNSIVEKNAQIKSKRIFILIARKMKRLNCSHYTMWNEQKACHKRHFPIHRQWFSQKLRFSVAGSRLIVKSRLVRAAPNQNAFTYLFMTAEAMSNEHT